MIPYRTNVSLAKLPSSNFFLIAIILLFFFLQPLFSPELTNALVLDDWSPVGLIGHQFLHANIGHLLGNLIFLWVFGNAVCARFGHLKYILFFLFVGVCAAAVHLQFDGAPAVGASGAINGVVGAFLVLYPLSKTSLWFYGPFTIKVPSIFAIMFWLVFDILGAIGNTGNVAYIAHIGGLAIGVVITMVVLRFQLIEMDGQEQSLVYLLKNRSKATRISGSVDFVEEIDKIIQRRLVHSSLDDKSIHVQSNKDGSLEIIVGDKIYQDLIEIEDRHVRDLIQASVNEWQNSNRD